jgi:4-azaleucine resistance transporter AzlC
MNVPAAPSRRAEFWAGARATFPLIVGAIPFGFIFGALAVNNGVSPAGAMAMSLFVFAGSAQFIAARLVGQGVGLGLIVATTLIINLRHALYSATLAPHVRSLSTRWLLPLGFWLTDETFVVVVSRYNQPDNSPYKHWYHLGSAVSMYVNWNLCTLLGLLAGQADSNLQRLGLDFALTVTFIGMLIPLIKGRPMLLAALVAGAAGVLFYNANHTELIIAPLLGVAAGVLAESRLPQTAAATPKEVKP